MPQSLREQISHMHLIGHSLDYQQESIFSAEEIRHEPIKWLKYLVLDRTGVESIIKISSQIHRFTLGHLDDAIIYARKIYAQSAHKNAKMTVVKVVPWNRGAQLKNFRIFSIDDIDPTFKKIREEFGEWDHELWLCESSVLDSGFNLGGRLTFPQLGQPQYIELIWYASPRLVESFSQTGFNFPYLRATRLRGLAEFQTEVLYIPDKYKKEGHFSNMWMDDFKNVARLLALKRDSINSLLNTLGTFGAKEVSFCFKVTNGLLTIIDWDSEIESTN